MFIKSLKGAARRMLTLKPRYGLLDHKKMEDLQKLLFSTNEKTLLLKLKFILKEAKYTLVQGSKDLWYDTKWLTQLYRKKTKSQFTGYQLAQSHRIKIDMIKFIPYSVILLVPFAELALPVLLWLFPNAVPSFYLFDTAWDRNIEKSENQQFESHQILIDKLTTVMSNKFKIEAYEFSRYEFFKEGFFEVIDELDQHLSYTNFSSDELVKVLEFLGGDFLTGTATVNKIVNLFTLNIPRTIVKILRWTFAKLTGRKLEPYADPFFVRGNFGIFQFNYFPFQFFKRRFLLWQVNRKFRMMYEQDRAFDNSGMEDVVGSNVKQFARERGLATLSCYETLKNVIRNDWVKFTTHPKFKNNNTKLWYSVMMYNFLKEASRDIN